MPAVLCSHTVARAPPAAASTAPKTVAPAVPQTGTVEGYARRFGLPPYSATSSAGQSTAAAAPAAHGLRGVEAQPGLEEHSPGYDQDDFAVLCRVLCQLLLEFIDRDDKARVHEVIKVEEDQVDLALFSPDAVQAILKTPPHYMATLQEILQVFDHRLTNSDRQTILAVCVEYNRRKAGRAYKRKVATRRIKVEKAVQDEMDRVEITRLQVLLDEFNAARRDPLGGCG
ncbi:hypothetical protein C8J57DRAFT_1541933 [Mycena rebaudengoi]|nr:hypothetical protein C8J57DRAFT_1541933 [Mycena rebaudengoi]